MIKTEEYKAYLSDCGSAKATIDAYISDIKEFDYFITDLQPEIPHCTADDIKAYMTMLGEKNISSSTVNRKMVSVRKYFDFLRDAGEIKSNPALRIKAPKIKRKSLEYLSVEDVDKILSAPDESGKGLRDKALLELMYACGLKAGEIVSANTRDLDLRIGFISCRGENMKSRIIPIGRPAKTALMKYLRESRLVLLGDNADDGALFLNYDGGRITRQGVWKIVKMYGKKAGLSVDVTPQIIRNTFAAHMIINGADLKSLHELLGNEDAGVTDLFMSLSKARIMDVYDKTHPRA